MQPVAPTSFPTGDLRPFAPSGVPSKGVSETPFADRLTALQSDGVGAAGSSELAIKFEAAVLTPLVAAILPSEESSVWGGGPGKLWRSLFAEEMASVIAQSGSVGIAPLIDQSIAPDAGEG